MEGQIVQSYGKFQHKHDTLVSLNFFVIRSKHTISKHSKSQLESVF